ncbi:Wzz/FepE/Etk N-terminal domain-containing protein, partial [Klebsiella pneumoniae]|uniref:Wzz/FepE/Etk N-terminal domain-containing protein n=1 Tax=Klebsiella pneumoniae TaxID=573 RepID=UPI003AC69E94
MASVTNNKQTPTESDDIDLCKIVGELIDHRKLIIFITTAFTVTEVLYVLQALPLYQAIP